MCLAGEQCGGTLLPKASGGQAPPPYAHGVGSYFGLYGTGQFDGQNSGHDYMGTVRRVLCCVVSVRPCSGHAPARVGVRQEHRERVGDPKRSFCKLVVRAQLYMPPTGFVNNCDGGRSHTYCDYRQQ